MDRAAGLGQCGTHTAVISTLKASGRRVTAISRGPGQRRLLREAPLRREEGTGPSVLALPSSLAVLRSLVFNQALLTARISKDLFLA